MFATDNPRGATVLRVLLVLVVAVALVLVGRATAPDRPELRRPQGVLMGYARSEDGARTAALTYASTRARTVLLAPERRRKLLEAFSTGRFARVAGREDRERDLAPLAGQEAARFQVAGLGSRVDRLDGGVALVTVWLFQVFAADETVGSFSTQRVRLVWQDGDWRLDAQQDAPAQAVPDIVQRPQRGNTRELVGALTPPTYGRPWAD